jgi:hypothetical protein
VSAGDWRVIAYTEHDIASFCLFQGPEAEAREIATQAPGAAIMGPDGQGGRKRTGTIARIELEPVKGDKPPTLKAEWIDGQREPTQPPDPKYPNGIDFDFSRGAPRTCSVDLPYPAKRIGKYVITCSVCGWTGLVTTAGRRDDPRSVKVPCK